MEPDAGIFDPQLWPFFRFDNHKLAIGQRLRTIRLKMGINQNVFARALNTAPNHICQIERGRCIPGSKLLRLMREQFGIDITWLLSGQSAATTTSLLKREIGALVEDYQRADANGKAFLVYTASFLVEGTEKQDPRSPSKK
ncbi:XRE family transcriptional regulator [Herbaspirillum huttiense]|nr:XRE family transcriptional regulator [Herbaspirillum huttiense]